MLRHAATLSLATITLFTVACDGSVVDPVATGSTGPETVTSAAGQAASEGYALPGANAQLAAIHELQSAFHGALNASDADAVRALFAEDATLQVGAVSAVGKDDIMAFFEAAPPFVLAHLNASGTMRKVGNRWLFQTFQGGVGSLQ